MVKKPALIQLAFLFLLAVVTIVSLAIRNANSRHVMLSMCALVEEHFYKERDDFKVWVDGCFKQAHSLAWAIKLADTADIVRSQLKQLRVSHLELYSPQAYKEIWQSESANDTGIRSRFVDGHLVIYKIEKKSAAEQAGLRIGDIIEKINGEWSSEIEAQRASGEFVILRNGKSLIFSLRPRVLTIDLDPSLQPLGPGLAVLKIPSLRGDLFEEPQWRSLANQLGPYRHIVADLRGNGGGSWVAMMRVFSALSCSSEQVVGYLYQERKQHLKGEDFLQDNLKDEEQIQTLSRVSRLALRTFQNYPCYRGKVSVLMDHGTASTAEVLVQILRENRQAKVYGTPSRGQVLLALWYPFDELGDGYYISIPQAYFKSTQGFEIESESLLPDRTLYYSLELETQGLDSWLEWVKAR